MAARLDITKKVTDKSAKRDVDYLQEWAGYIAQYEEAKTAAESSGAAFDDAAVVEKIKASLGIAAIDAELDAARQKA